MQRLSERMIEDMKLAGPQQVLDYFGRYLHRLPVSDGCILSHSAETVIVACRDATTGETRRLAVAPPEFMRRCLQQVPPPGFHLIRYYGLWSPATLAYFTFVVYL